MQDNNQDYSALVRQVGRKQRKVLHKLQNEDYLNSVAKDMKMSFNGVKYHAQHLEELGLIQKTAETRGRQYWKITQKGEVILDMVNVPQ